jgi:hypothetical protein
MNARFIAWLARQTALKVAESFIVPPRKVTPRGRSVKPHEEEPDFDEQGRPSQTPHHYGVTRRSRQE